MAECGSDSEVFSLETDAVPDTDQEVAQKFQAQSLQDRSPDAGINLTRPRPAAVEKSNTPKERVQISVGEDDHQHSDNQVDIEKYRHRLPPNLQADYYDGIILYFEGNDDDCNGAKSLLLDMTRVELAGGEKPKVALFHDILPHAMGLTDPLLLDLIIKKCTVKFLYITESFCDDAWQRFASSVCLMKAIRDEAWSVIPIFTTDTKIKTPPPPYDIPYTIMELRGVNNYKSTTFPKEVFRKLFESQLTDRMNQNAVLKKRRIAAIKEMKDLEKKEKQDTAHASTVKPQTTPLSSVTYQPQTSSLDASGTAHTSSSHAIASHTPSSDAPGTSYISSPDAPAAAHVTSPDTSHGEQSSPTEYGMEAHTMSPRALEKRGSPSEQAPAPAERASTHVSANTRPEESSVNDETAVTTVIPETKTDPDGGATGRTSTLAIDPSPTTTSAHTASKNTGNSESSGLPHPRKDFTHPERLRESVSESPTCSVSEAIACSTVYSEGDWHPVCAKAGHAYDEPPPFGDHQASKSASARPNCPPPKYCEQDSRQVIRFFMNNYYFGNVRNQYGTLENDPARTGTTVNIKRFTARTVMMGNRNQQLRGIPLNNDGTDVSGDHAEEQSVADQEGTIGGVQETNEPETAYKYGSDLGEYTPPRSPVPTVRSADCNSDDEDTQSKMAPGCQ